MYIPPEHARTFGGGADVTTLSPIVLAALVIAVPLILVLPRKYMVWPISFALFLIPTTQQVLVGSVHLFAFRIIVLVGAIKMLIARATSQATAPSVRFNAVDRVFLLYSVCQACAVVLLFRDTDSLINQVGFLWDYLGGYFLFRYLVEDEEDIFRVIKCFAFLAFTIGACMVAEHFTRHNIFGLIGGDLGPELRNGRWRCDGPFRHALTAGAFGATLLPLFFLAWKREKFKVPAAIGVVASVLITWNSSSSTSLIAFAAALLPLVLWRMRKKMRALRWGIVLGLVALQLVMKAPVWFLIARVDLVGGSQSYHRAELVDQFVRHFWDWWLIGTRSTGFWGWGLWDAQNQFVLVGETGGLLAFILFIAVISRSFARLGNARKIVEGELPKEWFLWLLGTALFSHVVAFFGVNYFDQAKFSWFALLAMIIAATAPVLEEALLPERQPHLAVGDSRLAYAPPLPAPLAVGKSSQVAKPIQVKKQLSAPVPGPRSRPKLRSTERPGPI